MAVATALSRATGFARTVAVAWALGATVVGDAYNVANTAPNMIFQLAAGGVLSSAVVPLLARASDRDRARTASALFGVVVAAGAVGMVLVVVAAPGIVRLLTLGASGRADHGALVDLSATWLRLFAVQVPAYAVSVFAVAVMTHHGRLVLGAAASISTNLVTAAGAAAVVVLVGTRPRIDDIDATAVLALGGATSAGVALMAGIQLWGAIRTQPGLRPSFRLRHPAVQQLLRRSPWVLLYVVVNQLGLAAVTAMTSSVPGGVSAYQWSFAVMQLPYAIIGVSLISASYPRVSALAAAGQDITVELAKTVRVGATILVPASALLIATARPLGTALVGPDDAALVAAGVVGFGVGLVPFACFQLLARTSYAHGDTKVPAIVNVAVNAVNVAGGLAIATVTAPTSLRVGGLAVAHALSYIAGTLLLARSLRRHRGVGSWGGTAWAPRVVVAALATGAAAAAVAGAVPTGTRSAALVALGAGGGAGALAFVGTAALMPLPGAPDLRRLLRGRAT